MAIVLKRRDVAPCALAPGLAVGKAQSDAGARERSVLLLSLEPRADRTERLDPQRGRTYRQCFLELGAAP